MAKIMGHFLTLQLPRRKFIQGFLATATLGLTLKWGTGCSKLSEFSAGWRQDSFKILSCDGGGIKGLITAIVLERLEQKLQERSPEKTLLRDYFDMFAGVSTGSIIACAIVKGIAASKIKAFYLEQASAIFPDWSKPQDWFSQVFHGLNTRLGKLDLSVPILENKVEALEAILQAENVFGQATFETLDKPTLILAYDTYNRHPIVFKNTQPSHSNTPDSRKIEIWQICRASAAVPIIFPSYFLDEPTFINSLIKGSDTETVTHSGQPGISLIDGAIVTNNPSLWAIAEAHRHQPKNRQNLLVASFGTGQAMQRINRNQAENHGGLDWLNPAQGIPLLDVIFDGSTDTVNEISTQLLNEIDRGQYLRYQPILEGLNISAFNSSAQNLNNMQAAARIYLAEQGGEEALDELVNQLT